MKNTSLIPSVLFGAILSSTGMLQGATIVGNLGGLTTPTGLATNANKDRQYAWTIAGTGAAAGAEVKVTYTVTTSAGNMSNALTFDTFFRYGGDLNVGSGQSLMITINTIGINSGWTLNSIAMSDTVTVAINGGRTARFSVNGGATFDYLGTGSGVSQQNVTDSRFEAFDAAGDTLSFQNVNQTENGGMNLRNLGMTFDVTAIPEPSAALLGGLGVLALLRRRRVG